MPGIKIVVLFILFFGCISCAFVEPKQVTRYDSECDIAYDQYTLGLSDTFGRGVIIGDNNIGFSSDIYAFLANDGSCADSECLRWLRSILVTAAVDIIAAGGYAVIANVVNTASKDQLCEQAPPVEPNEKKIILEEDLSKII